MTILALPTLRGPDPKRDHTPRPFRRGLRALCPVWTRCPIGRSRWVPRVSRREPCPSGRTSRTGFLQRDGPVTAHRFGYRDQRRFTTRSSPDVVTDRHIRRQSVVVTREHSPSSNRSRTIWHPSTCNPGPWLRRMHATDRKSQEDPEYDPSGDVIPMSILRG